MIFALGGFAILIISFAVALISLIREQKTQHGIEEFTQDGAGDTLGEDVGAVASMPNQSGVDLEKNEEEIKLAQKEEAYRILQRRVIKMTESETGRLSAVAPEPESEAEPETNIEDPLEGDIALSQKVPLPWEDSVLEPDTDSQKPYVRSEPTSVVPSDENKNPDLNDKLSGQINIGDLDK